MALAAPDHRAEAEAIVARQQARFDAEARRIRGLSGSVTDYMSAPESVEAVEARLVEEAARRLVFGETPRGRFLACIRELEEVGYGDEARRLRGEYDRSISHLSGPEPDVRAVGRCLAILAQIDLSTAREGVAALGDLLSGERRAA